MVQNVFAAKLVVEHVETESRLRLRLTIKLSLKDPDLFRCFEAHCQSPRPHYLRKHTRSQGPSLRRHYPASSVVRPCPTPARSAARCDVGVANSNQSGPPPITRVTLPACRATYPGGPNGCVRRLLPSSHGLPRNSGGSASASSLSRPAQALLALRPAGLLSRQSGLCHEASTRLIAQPSCSSATRSIDNSPGGTFLHWC